MRLSLSPKTIRNIIRILPFPIIWSLTGWAFTFVEYGATGTLNPDPETAIGLSFGVVLFAGLAMAGFGLMVGIIELVYLENLFRNKRLLLKIFYKLLLYAALTLVIVCITYPVAASIEIGASLWDPKVWHKFFNFMGSLTFFSTIFQLSVCLIVCLIYAAISELIGHTVLLNFLTGRYHQPREEMRIFMFLDMRSSTSMAEQLGHRRYFLLLRSFYDDLGKSIINYGGQVYQYVGDEIVISWNFELGIRKNNCLKCFYAMKMDLERRKQYYKQEFGVVPSFKAGLHYGQVTIGEIGALKKDIAFSGDVLNASARIQALCNKYQSELLVSGDLIKELEQDNGYQFTDLGEVNLKGREEGIRLFAVNTDTTPKAPGAAELKTLNINHH